MAKDAEVPFPWLLDSSELCLKRGAGMHLQCSLAAEYHANLVL
jgi:hypothetical protein